MAVRLTYDDGTGVLYARREEERCALTRFCETDDLLAFNVNASGEVIGMQLEAARELGQAGWLEHAGRTELPSDLQGAVDGWYRGDFSLCLECGGHVSPVAKPGRTVSSLGKAYDVPADLVLLTCDACGATWSGPSEAQALDRAIAAAR